MKDIDPLKYQKNANPVASDSGELLTVKFRYKEPDGNKSKLLTQMVKNQIRRSSNNPDWSMAVAGFGMLMRDSEYKGDLTYAEVISLAKSATGEDEFGYRGEFLNLVDLAKSMSTQ